MGAKTLKGENCVKRQGNSSDNMIAEICSILPNSSCLRLLLFQVQEPNARAHVPNRPKSSKFPKQQHR